MAKSQAYGYGIQTGADAPTESEPLAEAGYGNADPMMDLAGLYGPSAPAGFNYSQALGHRNRDIADLSAKIGPQGVASYLSGLYGASQQESDRRHAEQDARDQTPDWLRYQYQNAMGNQYLSTEPTYALNQQQAVYQRMAELARHNPEMASMLRSQIDQGKIASAQAHLLLDMMTGKDATPESQRRALEIISAGSKGGKKGEASPGEFGYGYGSSKAIESRAKGKKDVEKGMDSPQGKAERTILSIRQSLAPRFASVLSGLQNGDISQLPKSKEDVESWIKDLSAMQEQLKPFTKPMYPTRVTLRGGKGGPTPSETMAELDPAHVAAAKELDQSIEAMKNALAHYGTQAFSTRAGQAGNSILSEASKPADWYWRNRYWTIPLTIAAYYGAKRLGLGGLAGGMLKRAMPLATTAGGYAMSHPVGTLSAGGLAASYGAPYLFGRSEESRISPKEAFGEFQPYVKQMMALKDEAAIAQAIQERYKRFMEADTAQHYLETGNAKEAQDRAQEDWNAWVKGSQVSYPGFSSSGDVEEGQE